MYRDRLEEIRNKKHITNKEWAEKSGVSSNVLTRGESLSGFSG